uniref:Uncharacterized protein n=1 Tax=Lotharella globosa TaxID=91324 RepID=A0A6U3B237_9EUKA|eukprot:CAMPEP_0167787904 /NCGR_PEP_ID=MMETSP0111_2-20121227/9707_1 /TAXON_ID=91324 /ORGANISM="Lotharella globosa, Strain CCCM811" /LENGTH=341 /DNA_ID=CAMNT_0007679649 /DNA_START=21 /DNA_END=1046 /DNA_ORIENTATION=+
MADAPGREWVWIEEPPERCQGEVRISQVENIDYTHWMVKHSGIGITHSGVLVETICEAKEARTLQTIIDLIVIENVPYIAIRYYGHTKRSWRLVSKKKWIYYYRKHLYNQGKKPWKLTIPEGRKESVSLLVDSDEWDAVDAVKTHTLWVENVAKTMQSRVRDGFHLLRRNCQHVAAWTVNTIEMGRTAHRDMKPEFIAAPPNKLFKLLSNDWLPDEMIEQQKKEKLEAQRRNSTSSNENKEWGELRSWIRGKDMVLWPLFNYLKLVDSVRTSTPAAQETTPSEQAILSAEEMGWMLITTQQQGEQQQQQSQEDKAGVAKMMSKSESKQDVVLEKQSVQCST